MVQRQTIKMEIKDVSESVKIEENGDVTFQKSNLDEMVEGVVSGLMEDGFMIVNGQQSFTPEYAIVVIEYCTVEFMKEIEMRRKMSNLSVVKQ
jgi:hypothetical protein